MIKILHAADLHLGSPFRNLDPKKSRQQRQKQLKIPLLLEQLCQEEDCQLVFLSGDLFDTPEPDPEVAAALKRSLGNMGVPVLISPGNHDFVQLRSPYLQSLPDNVHVFTSPVMTSLSFPQLNARVWGAGFTSMDCPGLLEGFHASGTETYQLGILHGDPTAPLSPCCPVTREQVASSGLQYLALGHIHKAGRLTAGRTLCAWPGCPMGRGFDETGSKGVLLVTLQESSAPSLQFIDLGLGQYEDISVFVKRSPCEDILSSLPQNTRDAIYRITLKGQCAPFDVSDLQRRLSPRFFHLILRDETAPLVDLWENAGEDSLEGLYFRLLKEGLENASPEQREIYTLAAQISRQILEGQEVTLP